MHVPSTDVRRVCPCLQEESGAGQGLQCELPFLIQLRAARADLGNWERCNKRKVTHNQDNTHRENPSPDSQAAPPAPFSYVLHAAQNQQYRNLRY